MAEHSDTGTEIGQRGRALIAGNTFTAKSLEYEVVNGLAMFEGDIVLGTIAEVEEESRRLTEEMSGAFASSVVVAGDLFRWPAGVVPIQIDADVPDQQRITDAIAHWESRTRYRFPPRTSEVNYVTFRKSSSGCSSNVGMRGGQQFVNVGPSCSTGNIIHEIGHTVGFWHEQSREDRDAFVTIHWDKIQPGRESEFGQHISDGDDVGPYDYGSIMHYPRVAFAADGVSETITPVDASATIGQRTALSAGDIASANALIGTPAPTPSTAPAYQGRLLRYPPVTSGPDVALWQQRMVDLGHQLVVDGKYGPISRAACIELQRSKGLSADGIVGPLTWAATFG